MHNTRGAAYQRDVEMLDGLTSRYSIREILTMIKESDIRMKLSDDEQDEWMAVIKYLKL